jgi:hypothetical protein
VSSVFETTLLLLRRFALPDSPQGDTLSQKASTYGRWPSDVFGDATGRRSTIRQMRQKTARHWRSHQELVGTNTQKFPQNAHRLRVFLPIPPELLASGEKKDQTPSGQFAFLQAWERFMLRFPPAPTRLLPASLLLLASMFLPVSAAPPGLGPAGDLQRIEFEAQGPTTLVGRNSRRQLLVTGVYSSGQRHDLTHSVTYTVDKPQVLSVNAEGLVIPTTDGAAVVTATEPSGKTASVNLTTARCTEDLAVNFENEIVPIFTKLGCNAGGCHGKADGQNGFRLSLLGFYPDEDYEFLVHEDRGRRIFPADPEYSLLLQKPANMLPHGGGQRMSPGTYEWDLVSSWIQQGMPYGSEEDPVLKKIEAVPSVREMNFKGRQQLSVLAHYSDGSVRDVTRLASYEVNHPEMAIPNGSGRITIEDVPGEVAVMVRFQGEVGVFRAVIPQGLPVNRTPPEKSFIDRLVFSKLRQLGIPPADLCDDATFIRRASVDLTGRLPSVSETEQFVADKDPSKRDRLVDRLVDSPGYSDYFANKWGAVLRNKRRQATDIQYTYRFHSWIRRALRDNMPYDQFVRSVLTATGDSETHPPAAWYREVATSTQQMEDVAQLFLGMRLACAKCHHHPFERWSQQDYYGFEAFFSQVGLKNSRYNPQLNQPDAVYVKSQIPKSRNPRTGLDVSPTGLGGQPLEIAAWDDARQHLVDWMAEPSNPFFAKALVNRYWKHFFGRGIVDPEDDLRVTNPPSNPELLDALSKHFVDQRFNLKDLVRTICKSSVYQLSSEPTEDNLADTQNFSRFYPRRLTAEVLYDAVNAVAETPSSFGTIPQGTTAVQLPDNGFNNYFLQVFGKPEAESACECERSAEANLSQSLHLLNSSDVQGRLQSGQGRAARFGRDKERSVEDRITEIYLAAFSRRPTPEEIRFVSESLNTYTNPQQAWEDVIWAVLNTREFQFVK